jgi:PleD family two-component response regulator
VPGVDHDRAVDLAEDLRQATARLRLQGFAPGELTLSLGVAAARGPLVSPAALMRAADECLYAAKSTRNAVGACTGAAGLPAAEVLPAR